MNRILWLVWQRCYWLRLWPPGPRMMERPFTRKSVQVATAPAEKANLQ